MNKPRIHLMKQLISAFNILLLAVLLTFKSAVAIEFDEIMEGAKQGNSTMQYYAGSSYLGGIGVPENRIEAVKWLTKAAKQGHTGAQVNLGLMYSAGAGIPENSIRSYVWYSMAKTQGDSTAASNLVFLKQEMTKQQIAEAQALAAKCFESNYKDCD
jgi:TPR repeat protein